MYPPQIGKVEASSSRVTSDVPPHTQIGKVEASLSGATSDVPPQDWKS